LAFLDEDQPYAPRRAPAPRRRGPERQQIVARRAIAIGVGILVLILLVVGIKGCVNARKQRGLENYASDVKSLVTSSAQLSDALFKQLENPGGSGEVSLQQAVESDRGIADGLLKRAQQISAPGQVSGAKASLVQAFQLRSDGISGLAAALQSGGSAKDTQKAAILAVDHMKELVASDVIYIRSKDAAEAAFSDADVSSTVLPSVFVPDPSQWLSPVTFEPLIGTAGGGTTAGGTPCPPRETCGLGLVSTTVGGVALTAGSSATITGSSLDVSVQNQGTVAESNVQVTARVSGGAQGSATVPSIKPNETKTATIKLKPPPKAGDSGSLTVAVQTVDGEKVSANNRASYTVAFSG
jgi:CARDB protein